MLAPKLFLNTFGGNPVCCAGGRAVLRVIDNEGIQANCAKVLLLHGCMTVPAVMNPSRAGWLAGKPSCIVEVSTQANARDRRQTARVYDGVRAAYSGWPL